MIDKVVEETRQNRIWDPDRWERIRAQAESLSEHYREVIERKRRSGDPVIHFAAYVSNAAMYGMDDVFRLMRKEPQRWDPRVVIIPDVSRGYAHQKPTYIKARQYFEEHYNEDISIEQYAASRSMSTSWFTRSFRNATGTSPMQYILQTRIRNAQTLLETTDDSITNIASIVGYDNPMYFSRLFSKAKGVSPTGYRKIYREKYLEEIDKE